MLPHGTELSTVVRMVRQQCRRPIQLFGDQQAHQHVRQRERTERPAFVGARGHVARVTFRTADEECEVASESAPVLEALRELL
jgi:hypothetical protein